MIDRIGEEWIDRRWVDGFFAGLRDLPTVLFRNPKDLSWMVRVPAGPFEMGDEHGGDRPVHSVYLDDYWIGMECVTNRQYSRFVDEMGGRPPWTGYGQSVWRNGTCAAEYLDHPVVCVCWDEALAYAKWAGCLLPTEAQWEKAARGPRGLIYPWGNEWDPERCRHYRNKGTDTTTSRAYSYPKGVSGYGCYNMSGNVWEWCMDWYEAGYYSTGPASNPEGPSHGFRHVDRGGSWWDSGAPYFTAMIRCGIVPMDRHSHRGFRLARTSV